FLGLGNGLNLLPYPVLRRELLLDFLADGFGIDRINSPLEPQPAPSLHQDSSSRVRIETRWRATCGTTKTRNNSKKQESSEGKKRRTDLDTSDLLLIENALVDSYSRRPSLEQRYRECNKRHQ